MAKLNFLFISRELQQINETYWNTENWLGHVTSGTSMIIAGMTECWVKHFPQTVEGGQTLELEGESSGQGLRNLKGAE